MARIESFLSARLFMSPQRVGGRLYFISNMGGHLSLYAMAVEGSVPEPLLPPDIAMQNPALINGYSFYVYPELEKILVMLDQDGDENYIPMCIPLDGGYPEPAFDDRFDAYRSHLTEAYADTRHAYIVSESRKEPLMITYQTNLETSEVREIARSQWGSYPLTANEDHSKVAMIEGYTMGDHALFIWSKEEGRRELVYGVPLEEREGGQEVPLNAISGTHFTPADRGLIFLTALFEDAGSLGYLRLLNGGEREAEPVATTGEAHQGLGEMTELRHLKEGHYLVKYNIDGVSWVYEGIFDEGSLSMNLEGPIVGQTPLDQGVLQKIHYDKTSDAYALAFSTATSPAQIFTVDGVDRENTVARTRERVLGVPQSRLSAGEDASFDSYDGERVSARLYLPSDELGLQPPYPLAYYIHGGPQSQEKPDFTWFSMPLIQFFTLNGFSIFVPNVRGSTGYGLEYTKKVDRDWGGDDRLDHVHAMTEVLARDDRVDTDRAGVLGRSYGGYMTLMLAGRHPELWKAAVDMFGPYDLLTFLDRLPETWKPYFKIALGDPEEDSDFLIERSPKSYLGDLACPMLVIQGGNDPTRRRA